MDEVITFEQWKKKYKPRFIEAAGPGKQYVNKDRTPAYTWFDTTKEDYDLMMAHAEPNTVWTERYNEDDKPYLTSGVGIVDRHCYYITKKSHKGRDITVYG